MNTETKNKLSAIYEEVLLVYRRFYGFAHPFASITEQTMATKRAKAQIAVFCETYEKATGGHVDPLPIEPFVKKFKNEF